MNKQKGMVMMDNKELTAYENIYSEIKETLLQSRKQAYTSVNFSMVQAYWQIGKIIVELKVRLWKIYFTGNIKQASAGIWEGIFGQNSSADEKVLCDVSNCERTAFAIDMDTLPGTSPC